MLVAGFQPALDTGWLGSRYLDPLSACTPGRCGEPAGVRTLVAVDAILALSARLAGRPTEAWSTLTRACAVGSVQADPVSEADVLSFPWAGLALGAKVACTAFSCLKEKGQAGRGQGHTAVLWTRPASVWTSCRRAWMCARSLDPMWNGYKRRGQHTPRTGRRGGMQFPPVPAPAWRLLLTSYEGPEEKRQAGGEGEEKREGRRGSRKKESCR